MLLTKTCVAPDTPANYKNDKDDEKETNLRPSSACPSQQRLETRSSIGARKVAEVPVNQLAADLGLGDVDEVLQDTVSTETTLAKFRHG